MTTDMSALIDQIKPKPLDLSALVDSHNHDAHPASAGRGGRRAGVRPVTYAVANMDGEWVAWTRDEKEDDSDVGLFSGASEELRVAAILAALRLCRESADEVEGFPLSMMAQALLDVVPDAVGEASDDVRAVAAGRGDVEVTDAAGDDDVR